MSQKTEKLYSGAKRRYSYKLPEAKLIIVVQNVMHARHRPAQTSSDANPERALATGKDSVAAAERPQETRGSLQDHKSRYT